MPTTLSTVPACLRVHPAARLAVLALSGLCPACDGPALTDALVERAPLQSQTPTAKATTGTAALPQTESQPNSAVVSVRINRSPVVHQMTSALNPLDVNLATTLRVSASDPDGDPLSYRWSSNCNGIFGENGPEASFTLLAKPDPASCAFHVEVKDGMGGLSTGDLLLAVGPIAVTVAGEPQIVVVFQESDAAQPGQTVQLGIDARDAGGQPLVFEWSATTGRFGLEQDLQPSGEMPGRSIVSWTAPDNSAEAWIVSVAVRNTSGSQTTYTFSDLRPVSR